MLQRFLDPATLASISSLDLVAKTVVDGFVAGLHRSPDFGFSQEFAEYRAYAEGDDLRHVDWNVFARTERCYLKRYRGETNSQLLVLVTPVLPDDPVAPAAVLERLAIASGVLRTAVAAASSRRRTPKLLFQFVAGTIAPKEQP